MKTEEPLPDLERIRAWHRKLLVSHCRQIVACLREDCPRCQRLYKGILELKRLERERCR